MIEDLVQVKSDRKSQVREFARELDNYIRVRYKYKKEAVVLGLSNTLGVNRSPVDLYIRFKPRAGWPDDTVVIARVGFFPKRKGSGAALLKFLVESAQRSGVRWIGVEQTHDGDDIQGFVKRFGFVPHKEEDNWLASVEVVAKNLTRWNAERSK